ncbi:MAG: DEAD/DEAH box helicase family protein, partial [Planctomycetes bacterium]|nr:DEAD/DEAH box helicase family protein [Planctomycetota bacterium]
LHLAENIDHFFVLAPNLTIYDKLIADFTPGTPKYVFPGIAEFAADPREIITGENYETGRGVRKAHLFRTGVHINVFNISKINSEVRGGKAPRIKRLQEYIGQSYFDYLAGLDDLVLLMDESHRYRGSAGVKAINELRPILGLELTATPQTEEGRRTVPFKNVIYNYPLARAMADGFVKEPAVVTRESFNPANYNSEQLERLKLEDGVRIHEHTKVELDVYARQTGRPAVKPFMLVVAQDTTHAEKIVAAIKADDFFEGRYKDRVITVHSKQGGEEKDETVAQLLSVERPDNPTEIVVHVNMLKEGWDVTNLYTIVPLRAADARNLVEQSIGRGLRLPYGQRAGVPAVDRLTIVAHDKFQAIIDEARRPGSAIHFEEVIIERDIGLGRRQARVVQPNLLGGLAPAKPGANPLQPAQASLPFTPAEQPLARATMEVIQQYEKDVRRVPVAAALTTPAIQAEIVQKVAAVVAPAQANLPGMEELNVASVVARTLEFYIQNTITLPRIVVVPTGEVTTEYDDFNLDTTNIALQPVPQDILIQHLRTGARELLSAVESPAEEARLEDYLVRTLIDFDDIDYESQAELLYKLARQMVRHLRSYLPDTEAVCNVLLFHNQHLAKAIHTQMLAHRRERAAGYEAQVSRGFETPRSIPLGMTEGEKVHDFRTPVGTKRSIPNMLFGGFSRCLYPVQKFSSDPERLFAVMLENEPPELRVKWFKPVRGQFRIFYSADQAYEPDFVVETVDHKYLCEPKRADEMTDPEVQAKARAAAQWCQHATEHEVTNDGKPWSYLLIPHDAINASATLRSLAALHTYHSTDSGPVSSLAAIPT